MQADMPHPATHAGGDRHKVRTNEQNNKSNNNEKRYNEENHFNYLYPRGIGRYAGKCLGREANAHGLGTEIRRAGEARWRDALAFLL